MTTRVRRRPPSKPLRGAIQGEPRVLVEADIRDLDEAEWDAVLGDDDLKVTHRFVRVCQDAHIEDARYAHVLIRDGRGPVAIASFSAFSFLLDLLAPTWVRRSSATIRRVLPRFLRVPLVVGGLPASVSESCLRVRPGADAFRVMGLLESVAEGLARETGARVVCFKEFRDAELPMVSPLERFGYCHAASLPSCDLALRWASFDEYTGAMRAGYRRQLRKAAERAEKAGLRWRVEPLGEHVGRIVPLYREVLEHAEFRLETLPAAFFELLAAEFPESRALLVEDPSGALVCAAVLLRGARGTTFLFAGVDHDRSRVTCGYEYLVAAVVAQALRWGAERVNLGQTSWAIKGRLGAEYSRRHLFLRWRGALGQRILRLALPVLFPERRLPPRRVFRPTREGEG